MAERLSAKRTNMSRRFSGISTMSKDMPRADTRWAMLPRSLAATATRPPTTTAAGGTAREIAEGVRILQSALTAQRPARYQIEAAIAALHDDAASAEETDWPQILAWYDDLIRPHRARCRRRPAPDRPAPRDTQRPTPMACGPRPPGPPGRPRHAWPSHDQIDPGNLKPPVASVACRRDGALDRLLPGDRWES